MSSRSWVCLCYGCSGYEQYVLGKLSKEKFLELKQGLENEITIYSCSLPLIPSGLCFSFRFLFQLISHELLHALRFSTR